MTANQLQQLWDRFLATPKVKDPAQLQRLLKDRSIQIEGETIKVNFENEIQLQQLDDFKVDLLTFLRVEARNGWITLQATLSAQKEKQLLYTSQQKYDELIKHYPMLPAFTKKFGLELEF